MSQVDTNLVALIRTIVKATIAEGAAHARVPAVLSGSVEDLDEDLDVAWIRMDQEATSGDEGQSDNWGEPGVLPTIRMGDTLVGDQVRLSFDGTAGASSLRTSGENVIVLPYGAESGRRIILDGNSGTVAFFDDAGALVGFLDPTRWYTGAEGAARVQIDPLGGVRVFHDNGQICTLLGHDTGLEVRDPITGLTVASLNRHDGFRLVDPEGINDIELVNSSLGSLPNPKYTVAKEANPSSSIVAPLAATFTSTPADDIEIYHAAAFLQDVVQAATWTPPGGATERVDTDVNPAGSTLAVSVATRDPASGVAGTFTSSQTNWAHGIGTHVVIRGGGATSPSFRSVSELELSTTATFSELTFTKPSGTIEGDVMVAFIAMGNDGGSVPLGWTVPGGWAFLGADFLLEGVGAAQSCLAVGCWAKLAGAAEPATTIAHVNWSPGTKTIHGSVVTIQNPDLIDGGPHIRISGRPIRRLLAFNELTAANATLCDFQNIPPGYDNLELVYEGASDIGTDAARRIQLIFNNDTGANYHYQITSDGAISTALATTRILLGAINGATAGHETSGSFNIYGYAATNRRRSLLGHATWVANADLKDDSCVGYWLNNTTAINRLAVAVDVTGAGIVKFAAGSRAFLYGY